MNCSYNITESDKNFGYKLTSEIEVNLLNLTIKHHQICSMIYQCFGKLFCINLLFLKNYTIFKELLVSKIIRHTRNNEEKYILFPKIQICIVKTEKVSSKHEMSFEAMCEIIMRTSGTVIEGVFRLLLDSTLNFPGKRALPGLTGNG